MAWNTALHIKLLNVLGVAAVIGINIWAVTHPVTDKDTYVMPAGYWTWIWTLIYFLFICMTFYQFTEPGHHWVVDLFAYRFFFLNVLVFGFMFYWRNHAHIAALVFAFLMMFQSNLMVLKLQREMTAESIDEVGGGNRLVPVVTVRVSLSMYHAWASVLVILALFSAFGLDARLEHAGPWTKAFVFLAFFFLAAIAVVYASLTFVGDPAGAAVISWTLLAIFLHQRDGFIRWTAFAFFIISLLGIFKAILYIAFVSYALVSAVDEERAPLLPERNQDEPGETV